MRSFAAISLAFSRTSVRLGFTLVELLMVLAVLGILAGLIAPRFTFAAANAQAATLRDDLRLLRTAILLYRAQHDGVAPGYPDPRAPQRRPTLEAFIAQLTQYTDVHGQVAAVPDATHRYGPYLLKIPINVRNGSAEVRFIGADEPFPRAPVGNEGWLYQPSTGTLAANVSGRDSQGVPWFDY